MSVSQLETTNAFENHIILKFCFSDLNINIISKTFWKTWSGYNFRTFLKIKVSVLQPTKKLVRLNQPYKLFHSWFESLSSKHTSLSSKHTHHVHPNTHITFIQTHTSLSSKHTHHFHPNTRITFIQTHASLSSKHTHHFHPNTHITSITT